jgi:hypothetical protein
VKALGGESGNIRYERLGGEIVVLWIETLPVFLCGESCDEVP